MDMETLSKRECWGSQTQIRELVFPLSLLTPCPQIFPAHDPPSHGYKFSFCGDNELVSNIGFIKQHLGDLRKVNQSL